MQTNFTDLIKDKFCAEKDKIKEKLNETDEFLKQLGDLKIISTPPSELNDQMTSKSIDFWRRLVEILIFLYKYPSDDIDMQFKIKGSEDNKLALKSLGWNEVEGDFWRCCNKPNLDSLSEYILVFLILQKNHGKLENNSYPESEQNTNVPSSSLCSTSNDFINQSQVTSSDERSFETFTNQEITESNLNNSNVSTNNDEQLDMATKTCQVKESHKDSSFDIKNDELCQQLRDQPPQPDTSINNANKDSPTFSKEELKSKSCEDNDNEVVKEDLMDNKTETIERRKESNTTDKCASEIGSDSVDHESSINKIDTRNNSDTYGAKEHLEDIEKWKCSRCDFENEGFLTCKMCDWRRSDELKSNYEDVNNEASTDNDNSMSIVNNDKSEGDNNNSSCFSNTDIGNSNRQRTSSNEDIFNDIIEDGKKDKGNNKNTRNVNYINRTTSSNNKWRCDKCSLLNSGQFKCTSCKEDRDTISVIEFDNCNDGDEFNCDTKRNKVSMEGNDKNSKMNEIGKWACQRCSYANADGFQCTVCHVIDEGRKKMLGVEFGNCEKVEEVRRTEKKYGNSIISDIEKWNCKSCSLLNTDGFTCTVCGTIDADIHLFSLISDGKSSVNDKNNERKSLNMSSDNSTMNYESKWNCNYCSLLNTDGFQCRLCDTIDEGRKNKLEIKFDNCINPIKSIFTWKCPNCNIDVTEVVCPQCQIDGPQLSNWVCEICHLYNDLLADKCKACEKVNENIKLCKECRKVYINISSLCCDKCFEKMKCCMKCKKFFKSDWKDYCDECWRNLYKCWNIQCNGMYDRQLSFCPFCGIHWRSDSWTKQKIGDVYIDKWRCYGCNNLYDIDIEYCNCQWFISCSRPYMYLNTCRRCNVPYYSTRCFLCNQY